MNDHATIRPGSSAAAIVEGWLADPALRRLHPEDFPPPVRWTCPHCFGDFASTLMPGESRVAAKVRIRADHYDGECGRRYSSPPPSGDDGDAVKPARTKETGQ